MRQFSVPGLLFFLLFSITACQKNTSIEGTLPTSDSTATDSTTATGNIVRIQQGTDVNLTNDTIYKISYTTAGKIKALVDSLQQDSLIAGYDGSGHLTSITDKGSSPINATYAYDATTGLLTEEDYVLAGSHEQYKFSYTNGVLSSKGYYSDQGSGGTPTLQYTYYYTFSNGNITQILAYTSTNQPFYEETFTYGPQVNPFQQLALFDYGGRLGTDAIFNEDTYFNKNIMTGVALDGLALQTNTNTFNATSGLITGINVVDAVDDSYTWTFSY